ncbi:hypothetical protein [Lysinibacter sp. HNR]|uniref:hypothetical protein n=1 Tax=Lysinibacter sp. HNR TaxID=3031408 RepID=UPI0024360A80|nr:hypothetical protein [Lysinibacter sp. HNR]WGD38642.1 hypothetical protein FrondiHNR_08655 [Lysinibacter sp. HNR]
MAQHLLNHVEASARNRGVSALVADVSFAARPFFARQGFIVEAEQSPVRQGVTLINYGMQKSLL